MCDEQRTQEQVDEEAVERPQEPDEDPQEPDEVPFFAKNEFTEALKGGEGGDDGLSIGTVVDKSQATELSSTSNMPSCEGPKVLKK
jgi:hypothetical protein